MKKLLIIILINLSILISGHRIFAEQGTSDEKVIAYYFHGSFRCSTCNRMEQFSTEALESNFKQEMNSKKLEFKAVNVEESENEHYVKDYQLYTKALILSRLKQGKEIQSMNLAKIWEYAGNKQKFIDYVTTETKTFLQGKQ